jgi:hypothetical protein
MAIPLTDSTPASAQDNPSTPTPKVKVLRGPRKKIQGMRRSQVRLLIGLLDGDMTKDSAVIVSGCTASEFTRILGSHKGRAKWEAAKHSRGMSPLLLLGYVRAWRLDIHGDSSKLEKMIGLTDEGRKVALSLVASTEGSEPE